MRTPGVLHVLRCVGLALWATSAYADLSDNLVAYYPFNGNANDATGHGYDGQLKGGIALTTDRFGNTSSAYAFDGVDDYIDLGTAIDVPSWHDYSVSVWFLQDGGGPWSCGPYVGYGQKIIDKTVWYHDFYLMVCKMKPEHEDQYQGGLVFTTYEGSGDSMMDLSKDYRDVKWHHAVITKKGAKGELWVDGVLVDTSESVKTVSSWGPLLVGYSLSGDYLQRRFFSGKIDDIRIYNRAVSAAEVQALYEESPRSFALCPGDINADGTADLAMVDANGQVTVKNYNGAAVSQFAFADHSLVAVKLMPDTNGNGAPEVVGLAANSHTAEVLDSLTGAHLATVAFDADLQPIDLALVADQTGNGTPELANLGQGSVKVQIKDGLNGQAVNTVVFSSPFYARDLAVYDDQNGNGAPELGVLGNSTIPGKSDRLEIRDLATGNRLRTLWLGGRWLAKQQALIRDFSGNGTQEVGVLRVAGDGAVNVIVYDSKTRQNLGAMGFDRNYPPQKLLVVGDVNGNGADEVVVFGARSDGANQKAQVKDSQTKALIRAMYFDRTLQPLDVAACGDSDGNGSPELVMLGKRKSTGQPRAVIKDVKSGKLIATVSF